LSGGRFVVLASRQTATIIEKEFIEGGFSVNSTHEILVNGHPATVLVGGREQSERQESRASGARQAKARVG
jgi:hypothetical protein